MKNFCAMSKEDRKLFVDSKLTGSGIPHVGRQARISSSTGISKPTVQAIMLGSMPRDTIVCLKFCSQYGIDFEEWVCGVKLAPDNLAEAIGVVRDFERQTGRSLNNQKFAKLVEMALNSPEEAETLTKNILYFAK
jgi:hypothetical protein